MWDPLNLDISGYGALFRRGLKLTTYHHLELRLRMRGVMPPLHIASMSWCLVNDRNVSFYVQILSRVRVTVDGVIGFTE